MEQTEDPGDFYVCGRPGTNGDCKLMTAAEWKGIWSNCKEKDGDKYYNAAKYYPGVNQFHMGACSDGPDVYDPVRNTGGAVCGLGWIDRRQGQTWDAMGYDSDAECRRENGWGKSGVRFGSRCGIGEIEKGK